MQSTLIQMTLLIGLGIVWKIMQPAGQTALQTRLVLTSVVYNIFLPALILQVLWEAEIGVHSLQYTLLGCICVLFAMLVIWLMGKLLRFDNPRMGAMILAASFPNVTYLGLPVLEQTYGAWARAVAIKLDLLAMSPLLFTLGIILAVHYGTDNNPNNKTTLRHLNSPPFWAAGMAILLSLLQVPFPSWLHGVLLRLADAVVPLMLFSLGLALNWQSVKLKNIPYVIPVIITKMFIMPVFALGFIQFLTIQGGYRDAAILEMAMPSMVLGIVFCDRYRLDTPLYVMAVSLTTLLSLFTLPLWYTALNYL